MYYILCFSVSACICSIYFHFQAQKTHIFNFIWQKYTFFRRFSLKCRDRFIFKVLFWIWLRVVLCSLRVFGSTFHISYSWAIPWSACFVQLILSSIITPNNLIQLKFHCSRTLCERPSCLCCYALVFWTLWISIYWHLCGDGELRDTVLFCPGCHLLYYSLPPCCYHLLVSLYYLCLFPSAGQKTEISTLIKKAGFPFCLQNLCFT